LLYCVTGRILRGCKHDAADAALTWLEPADAALTWLEPADAALTFVALCLSCSFPAFAKRGYDFLKEEKGFSDMSIIAGKASAGCLVCRQTFGGWLHAEHVDSGASVVPGLVLGRREYY
jgi:hypothetical protein